MADQTAGHSSSHREQQPPKIEFRSLRGSDDPTPFRLLNEEWIRRHFTLEPKDQDTLSDPKQHILDKGGRVFLMYAGGEPVGSAALLPSGHGVYELSKMAVAPSMRGLGLGRQLLAYTIRQAKLLGATSLFLGSNTRLQQAVHLYEAFGFRHVAPDRIPNLGYTRANVFMELPL